MLTRHLCDFVGETVTIFTTSGGPSGCGFTGVLLDVNPCFVRLLTKMGTPPTNPLAENICGDFDGGYGPGSKGCGGGISDKHQRFRPGSVCDIPVNKIASFCHNAV
ncbi:MAG: hypothetical protein GX359_06675 [Clostridiales bacterium]|nr:hypothetical protein [Clostridiales bacterium]